ncbi:hypothetical protein ACFLZD_02285 [Candidatus Neomarinimicrobiota bacterium]
MKIFILKIVVLSMLLLIIVTIFLSFCKMFYNGPEYPMWRSKFEYVQKNHNSENIIIGDSGALAGIVPEIIGDGFYNLSYGGGTPIEIYFLLKKYISNEIPKTIIISFTPFHLEYSNVFFGRPLKYNIFSTKEIVEILKKSKELNNKFYSYADRNSGYKTEFEYLNVFFKSILTKWNFFYYYRPEMRNSLTQLRILDNIKVYNEIKTRKGNYDFGQNDSSSELNFEATNSHNGFTVSSVMDYYLNQTIELALENSIKVYYIVTPFNEASYNNLNINYIRDYDSYFNSLKHKHKNVVWHNQIFSYEDNYFGDKSHLNSRGQVKFSKYIINEILQ